MKSLDMISSYCTEGNGINSYAAPAEGDCQRLGKACEACLRSRVGRITEVSDRVYGRHHGYGLIDSRCRIRCRYICRFKQLHKMLDTNILTRKIKIHRPPKCAQVQLEWISLNFFR